MRVSILNLNLVGPDAIGQSILNQLRFFQRRGDEVRLYLSHPTSEIPEAVVRLSTVTGSATAPEPDDAHFARSDLYIYHYPGYYPLVESMRSIARGKVIFFYHNVTPSSLWLGSDDERLHLDNSRRQLVRLLPYADRIVTPSEYNAQELMAEFGVEAERLCVLPLAVSLEAFAPRPADPALRERYGLTGKQLLLFVGRMAGNKRVELLVEALALLRDRFPLLHLLLVGDDRSNEGARQVVQLVRERATAGGVAERVHLLGRVEEVAPLFNLADLYVTASLHEGFGVPLIEAMASGLPVVASEVAAHPAVLGDAGCLVPPDDPPAMAEAIAALLSDDQRYGALVRRGLQRSKQFSTEAFFRQWGTVVTELMADLPPSLPLPTAPPQAPAPPRQRIEPLGPLVDALAAEAATMDRHYQVRSGAPLVGPLIGWLRRTLTSHLREPYIDPTFSRQERFNQQVAQALRLLAERDYEQASVARQVAQLQALSQAVRQHRDDPNEQAIALDRLDAALARLRAALMIADTPEEQEE